MERKELLDNMAVRYCKLLNAIDWSDKFFIAGLREGLNKFLSNTMIALNGGPKSKYWMGDYYSDAALVKIKNDDANGLVFEHMVPKQKHIQDWAEGEAQKRKIEVGPVRERLEKYWWLAVITAEEDKQLTRTKMPDGWDKDPINIFARYEQAGIKLKERPVW